MTAQAEIRGKIAVIVVDYNSEKLLRRCLDSLVALARRDLVFIVVDNGRSVDAAGLAADYTQVVLLHPGKNLGFAGGCNLGLKHALEGEAAWCLLLNPDTRAETDFIGSMLQVFERDSRLGMACPTILKDTAAREIWFAGCELNWWLGRPSNIRDRRLLARGGVQPVPCLTGCAMMLRPQAVREVGYMEEQYFLYFEDTDYARAFIDAGWGIAYLPEAEMLHQPSSTTGFQSERYVYYFARNRVLFMRRWGWWPHRVAFTLFHTFVRLPGALIVFGLLRRRPGAAIAFLKGWAAGMAGR